MNRNATKENLDLCMASLLEALKQNWESARYFESSRWKYIYAYYVAFGVFAVYVFKYFLSSTDLAINLDWRNIEPAQCLFLFVMSALLVVGGVASFFHLLHSNMSYKNHIRAIQWISEHLNLNKGISKYLEAKHNKIDVERLREIDRYTLMALPLPFSIRKTSFKFLTILLILISSWASFWFFMLTVLNYVYPDWPSKLELPVRLIWFILIPLALLAGFYRWLALYWCKTECKVEDELRRRKPPFLHNTDESGH